MLPLYSFVEFVKIVTFESLDCGSGRGREEPINPNQRVRAGEQIMDFSKIHILICSLLVLTLTLIWILAANKQMFHILFAWVCLFVHLFPFSIFDFGRAWTNVVFEPARHLSALVCTCLSQPASFCDGCELWARGWIRF